MPAASVNIKKCQNILAFFVLLYEDGDSPFAGSDREFSLLLAFRGQSPTDSHYLTTDSARFLVSGVGSTTDIRYMTADSACFLVSEVGSPADIRYMTADSACFLVSGAGSPTDSHYMTTDSACFLLSGVSHLQIATTRPRIQLVSTYPHPNVVSYPGSPASVVISFRYSSAFPFV